MQECENARVRECERARRRECKSARESERERERERERAREMLLLSCWSLMSLSLLLLCAASVAKSRLIAAEYSSIAPLYSFTSRAASPLAARLSTQGCERVRVRERATARSSTPQ